MSPSSFWTPTTEHGSTPTANMPSSGGGDSGKIVVNPSIRYFDQMPHGNASIALCVQKDRLAHHLILKCLFDPQFNFTVAEALQATLLLNAAGVIHQVACQPMLDLAALLRSEQFRSHAVDPVNYLPLLHCWLGLRQQYDSHWHQVKGPDQLIGTLFRARMQALAWDKAQLDLRYNTQAVRRAASDALEAPEIWRLLTGMPVAGGGLKMLDVAIRALEAALPSDLVAVPDKSTRPNDGARDVRAVTRSIFAEGESSGCFDKLSCAIYPLLKMRFEHPRTVARAGYYVKRMLQSLRAKRLPSRRAARSPRTRSSAATTRRSFDIGKW